MRKGVNYKPALSSRVQKTVEDVTRTRCDSQEFESIVRAEINAAIEESFSRNKAQTQGTVERLKLLEDEAQKMLDSVEAAKARDDFSRKHNLRMKNRERIICGFGMLCLVCPVLVIFSKVMTLFPKHHVEILQYASQQDSLYGATSRFCLKAVLTARHVSDANFRSGYAYFWGCFGAMVLLLLLVRHTTTKHAILTAGQREQIAKIKLLIEQELQDMKRSMLEPFQNNHEAFGGDFTLLREDQSNSDN